MNATAKPSGKGIVSDDRNAARHTDLPAVRMAGEINVGPADAALRKMSGK